MVTANGTGEPGTKVFLGWQRLGWRMPSSVSLGGGILGPWVGVGGGQQGSQEPPCPHVSLPACTSTSSTCGTPR